MDIAPSKRGPYYARERSPDFLAKMSFNPGRAAYYQSNSQFVFHFAISGFTKYMYFEFTDRERVYPGEDASAWFWLIRPEMHVGKLWTTLTFDIELFANGVVGYGAVTDICDKRLERPA